jgi:hypothetical protein
MNTATAIANDIGADALSAITAPAIASAIGMNHTALGLLRCPASFGRLRELFPQAHTGRA